MHMHNKPLIMTNNDTDECMFATHELGLLIYPCDIELVNKKFILGIILK